MRLLKVYLLVFSSVLFFLSCGLVLAQDSTLAKNESMVKVTGRVNKKKVPLNRFLTFTVKVEWTGDIDRYLISELEDPIFENLEIYSTSSADFRMSENGVSKAAKSFEFLLKPKNLGMAYIEAVMVKYIDNQSGDGYHLVTNRINVEIIDPEPEPGSRNNLFYWIIILTVLVAAIVGIAIWRYRLKAEKREQGESIELVPLEDEFLKNLRESVDINNPDLSISDTYYHFSKIFRKYLAQKYNIAALELTTDELVSSLKNMELEEVMLSEIQEILRVCDVAKFAGGEGDRSQLDRVYSQIESILEKNLAEANLQNTKDVGP